MVFTVFGLSGVMLRLGSNIATPGFIGIGSGSGAATTAKSGLVAELLGSRIIGSMDLTTVQQITWTSDVSASTMSGINLREFALYSTSGTGTFTCWSIDAFPSITFDGSNELQIILTVRNF